MQPASQIVARCGGYKVVAAWLRLNRSTVQRWTYPRPEDADGKVSGTGGLIPVEHWPALIERAKENGVEITVADLLPESLRGAQ